MVTAAQIKKLCPSAKAELVKAIVDNWGYAVLVGDITTPLRTAHFFAQIATETGGLKAVEESLNYSVDGLLSTFGRHRITEAQAKKYGRTSGRKADQVAIANIVYGGAWGKKNLGNTQPNDGWDYRGGGMGQTTGRDNYRQMGFESNPQALREPKTAFETAVREWKNRKCNAIADRDDLTALRKVWNGGTNGLAEAKAYLAKGKTIFTATTTVKTVNVPVPQKLLNTPSPDTGVDLVERVQALLWDKGYPEVGNVDGKFGARTRNAILAFQADNKLPLTGNVTDLLLAQLVKAPKREMAESRVTATEKDLKTQPVVNAGGWLKKVGGTLFAGSMIGGGVQSIDSLNDQLTSAQNLLNTVKSFAPWAIYVGAGVLIYYFGRKIVSSYIQSYRDGRTF